MPNPLYSQLNGANNSNTNPMFNRIKQFKETFSGDPKAMIQRLLDSGKVSQAQMNEYVQQANEIYKMFK